MASAMSKHSPGPWVWQNKTNPWNDSADRGALRDADDLEVIGIEDSHDYGVSMTVNDVDAALIAAAPEMLALLRRCHTALSENFDNGGWCRDDLEEVAALLKRLG